MLIAVNPKQNQPIPRHNSFVKFGVKFGNNTPLKFGDQYAGDYEGYEEARNESTGGQVMQVSDGNGGWVWVNNGPDSSSVDYTGGSVAPSASNSQQDGSDGSGDTGTYNNTGPYSSSNLMMRGSGTNQKRLDRLT